MGESVEVEKNYLKNIVVMLGVAILSSVAGYFINDYFSREKISIAHIGIKPKSVTILATNEFKQHVTRLNESNYISFLLGSNSRNDYNSEEIKTLLEQLSNEEFSLTENKLIYEEEYKNITKMKDDGLDLQSFYRIASKYLDNFSTDNNQSDLDILLGKISSLKTKNEDRLTKVTSAIKIIVNESLRSTKERQFQIDIIILNSGKTQALIRNSGYLRFGEDIVYLKENESRADSFTFRQLGSSLISNGDFVIVKEKEFSSISLVVDKYNNRQRMLDLVKREYLNGNRDTELVLRDSNDNEIVSDVFIFRNDLEEDRKVTLNEYIENHYKKYIENNYSASN
ncbi:hypothetical protein [Aliivibrio fischeri]|uniref:hypothetical protein n=1 Tax=Aliivibrio fischeri TaxID=668 RepID=UPI00080E9EB3|nr:hypothetical protein [Aliivibrio fischeri]OCH01851.1 hypothetical protein A6E10_18385 [Aliivibrio fischeri]